MIETRSSYDTVAADYVAANQDGLNDRPFDRAMLELFAELVQSAGGMRVADLGCGPGHATAHLKGLGLEAFGVDLSSAMVEQARQAHPELSFREGSLSGVDLPDRAVDGIVALYSFNTIPPEYLLQTFAEFARLLTDGGRALLAFQIRQEPLPFTEWFGSAVSLPLQRLVPEEVAQMLATVGLSVDIQMVREPHGPHEKRQHAHLIAVKVP